MSQPTRATSGDADSVRVALAYPLEATGRVGDEDARSRVGPKTDASQDHLNRTPVVTQSRWRSCRRLTRTLALQRDGGRGIDHDARNISSADRASGRSS